MVPARWFERLRARGDEPWLAAGLVVSVGAVVGTITWLMEHGSFDAFAAAIVSIVIVAISAPMLRRAARLEADPRIARLIWIAFGCKLLAALPRYAVTFGLYDGQADAATYHRVGATLARQFRDGDFMIDIGRKVQGTGFIQILTGGIYTITGATSLGGFIIYSWLGFWGLYLFHRAFVRACPQGDQFRYACLVFLLPSLLFWPSSIGKEAWMCLGLGACAYGVARVLSASRGGLIICGIGLTALGAVRPHISALVAISLFAAYILRRSPRTRSGLAPFGKLVGIGVLGMVLVLAVSQLETFLGVDAFNRDSIEATLSDVTDQTSQGTYDERSQTNLSITGFPLAFVNVTFRPFPWQATNLQSAIASLEGVFLIGLVLAGWPRILGMLRAVIDTPYVIFAGTYTVLFVYGFSSFANYGILIRQRVQVLPFLLVFLALPPIRPRDLIERDAAPEAGERQATHPALT